VALSGSGIVFDKRSGEQLLFQRCRAYLVDSEDIIYWSCLGLTATTAAGEIVAAWPSSCSEEQALGPDGALYCRAYLGYRFILRLR
jgi:hypothetical protein